LNINQVIYTIQGEGQNIGKPSLLVRLQGCNLKCPWCDTVFARDKKKKKNEEYLTNEIDKIIEQYGNIGNIMITGGEPFLQFDKIMKYFEKKLSTCPIEIETNGTLLNENIESLVKHKHKITLNISPKLDIQCHHLDSVFHLFQFYRENMNTVYYYRLNYNIKYVYDHKDENCVDNLMKFLLDNNISRNKVYIMTKTDNRNMDFENCLRTVEFCKKYNFRYTPRMHLLLFNDEKEKS